MRFSAVFECPSSFKRISTFAEMHRRLHAISNIFCNSFRRPKSWSIGNHGLWLLANDDSLCPNLIRNHLNYLNFLNDRLWRLSKLWSSTHVWNDRPSENPGRYEESRMVKRETQATTPYASIWGSHCPERKPERLEMREGSVAVVERGEIDENASNKDSSGG
jgi:hypothetical protein